MEPCLLLLLSETPSHGYDLISKLVEFGFSRDQDPGMVYRTLRRLEEQGMIRSNWAVSGTGPARREYVVTDEGREYLRAWAETIRNNIETLSLFLERFRKLDSSSTQAGSNPTGSEGRQER
ncbi:MAG: helix-turn-helix transcriptional regulator [Firmicutes bacterium]|nr:helix-turn-helix transcriptional regulator [Candidatus Fermentithermobacillaceae bacterium]